MNRSFPRNLIIAAAVLTLTFATFPMAASAQPSKAPALETPTSWLGAALTWIGKLPIPGIQAPADRGVQRKVSTDTTGSGIKLSPHTGVCIDPDGYRVPCPGV